ncbi:MAG TPA: hypothetical protein VGL13_02435 [Polyangiaceae bacterium]
MSAVTAMRSALPSSQWISIAAFSVGAYGEGRWVAYRNYFAGRIAMGIEVPPEAWGGHIETTGEIGALATAVQSGGGTGLMLWSLQKPTSAQSFASAICAGLDLGGCNAPLF